MGFLNDVCKRLWRNSAGNWKRPLVEQGPRTLVEVRHEGDD